MFVYLFSLIFILSVVFLQKKLNIENNKAMTLMVFFPLYFLLAFRAPVVGHDTIPYINIFNLTKEHHFLDFGFSRHEQGYLFVNKLLSFIQNEQVFIALISLIPLVIFFTFIYKESKIAWLSIYLFITLGFYESTFNIFRQVFAMSILTIAYFCLIRNKKFMFVLTVLIASLFHVTALIFLVVYPIRRLQMTNKNLVLISLLASSLYLFSVPIVQFGLDMFSSIDYEITSSGGEKLLILMLAIYLVGVYFKDDVLKANPNALIMYNILLVGVLVQIIALNFSLFSRVTQYFSFYNILFLPEIVRSIDDEKVRKLAIVSLIVLTPVQFYLSLRTDPSGIVPYQFFWML